MPFEDDRIAQLARKHRRFNTFMSRFTDAFGVPQRPAVLLARKRSKITGEAMASFRDLVVLSVVPHNRAELIVYGRGSPRILFSNSFWLYPWMLDKNYEWLITQSLASLGLNEVRRFKGQATPEFGQRQGEPGGRKRSSRQDSLKFASVPQIAWPSPISKRRLLRTEQRLRREWHAD